MKFAEFIQLQLDLWPELRLLPTTTILDACQPMFDTWQLAKKVQEGDFKQWRAEGRL